MFRFYLDGNLVSDPVNWKDFTETIERDDIVKGLLPKYELKLNFTGGGYEFLYNAYLANGFCHIAELKVEQKCDSGYEQVLLGSIFISDCKFNLNKCYVECSVEDNNFGARIRNNKSIKTALTGAKSKNGFDITPATSYQVEMFNPANGAVIADTRMMILYHDAFRFLVDFMTDGLVGFESNFLTNISNGICKGEEMRTHSGLSPFVSFDDLFKELDKKHTLGFTMIEVNGKPTIKIEQADFFYGSSSSLTVPNIEDLNQSFDNEFLYSNYKIGGKTVTFNPVIHTFVPRQFVGFQQEEYFLAGVCNIDKTFDLEADYILDSNIIEELVFSNTNNKAYDKDTFIVELVPTFTGYRAVKTVQLSGGYYYNATYTNEKISNRNSFQGDSVLYSGLDTSGFRAETTNRPYSVYGNIGFRDFVQFNFAVAPPQPAPPNQISGDVQANFNDDITTPNRNQGGNYYPLFGKYVVPLSGGYYFFTKISFKVFKPSPSLPLGINRKWRINIKIKQYNAANVAVNSLTTSYPSDTSFYNFGEGHYDFMCESYFDCEYLDYIKVFASIESYADNQYFDSEIRGLMDNTSFFTTTATQSGGGVFQTGDTGVYKASKLEFDRPLSNSEYNTLKQDLSKSVIVNHDGISNKIGWLRKTSRKLATGEMKWELISDINNS